MSAIGQRKAALFLATLSAAERRTLLATLPASTVRGLKPLVDELLRRGWTAREPMERVLADDLRGLTAETTLDVEQMMRLAGQLPPEWYARVLAAAGPVDHEFMLALLDAGYARRVRAEMAGAKALPPVLAQALLAEAMQLAAGQGDACAA
jgi:hypothetical protein